MANRPLTTRVTKREADALIDLPKYIRRLPVQRNRNGFLRMKTDNIYLSHGGKSGLIVDAKMTSKTHRGGATPSVALMWRNTNIRCIDWEVRHEFADGQVVCGWHEHLWDDTHGRDVGHAFEVPLGVESDLEQMFVTACQHWGVIIKARRNQVLRERSDD